MCGIQIKSFITVTLQLGDITEGRPRIRFMLDIQRVHVIAAGKKYQTSSLTVREFWNL